MKDSMYGCRSDHADWYATLGDPFHLIRGGPERAVFRQFSSAKTFYLEQNSYPSDKHATRRHDFPMRTRKTHFFGIRKQSRTRQVDIVLG